MQRISSLVPRVVYMDDSWRTYFTPNPYWMIMRQEATSSFSNAIPDWRMWLESMPGNFFVPSLTEVVRSLLSPKGLEVKGVEGESRGCDPSVTMYTISKYSSRWTALRGISSSNSLKFSRPLEEEPGRTSFLLRFWTLNYFDRSEEGLGYQPFSILPKKKKKKIGFIYEENHKFSACYKL